MSALSRRRIVREASVSRGRAAVAFGSALRFVRAERGVSQMNLAVLSDLDPSYVSLLERGHRVPSFIVVIRLADALEVSAVRLFAEGVVRLPEASNAEIHAVYRLAFLGPDEQLIEVEGLYSNFSAAIRLALLQNIARRNAGEPEFTHLVEYIRTSSFSCRR